MFLVNLTVIIKMKNLCGILLIKFKPCKQFICCIKWGYGHKCPTYSVEMAIKQNNSMTGWNEGHCFAILIMYKQAVFEVLQASLR